MIHWADWMYAKQICHATSRISPLWLSLLEPFSFLPPDNIAGFWCGDPAKYQHRNDSYFFSMRILFLSIFLDVAILPFFHIASTPVSLAKYICIENSDKNRDPFAFNTGVSADSSSCLPLVAVWSTSGTRVKSHRGNHKMLLE